MYDVQMWKKTIVVALAKMGDGLKFIKNLSKLGSILLTPAREKHTVYTGPWPVDRTNDCSEDIGGSISDRNDG